MAHPGSKPTDPAAGRRPLPTGQAPRGSSLTLRPSWGLHSQASRTSSSPAVPLPCHSQRSWLVPSGQSRITPQRPRPALFPAVAADQSGRSGFASRRSARAVETLDPDNAQSVLAPTQGGFAGNVLATRLWKETQEPVFAGGRDRFRTCGLCRDAPVDGQAVAAKAAGACKAAKTSRAT